MACQSLGEPGCTQAQVTEGSGYRGQVWEKDRPDPKGKEGNKVHVGRRGQEPISKLAHKALFAYHFLPGFSFSSVNAIGALACSPTCPVLVFLRWYLSYFPLPRPSSFLGTCFPSLDFAMDCLSLFRLPRVSYFILQPYKGSSRGAYTLPRLHPESSMSVFIGALCSHHCRQTHLCTV